MKLRWKSNYESAWNSFIHSSIHHIVLASITSVIENRNLFDTSSGMGISHTVPGHDRIVGSNEGATVAPTFIPCTCYCYHRDVYSVLRKAEQSKAK